MPTTPPLCRQSLPSNCGPARPRSGAAPSPCPPTPPPPPSPPPPAPAAPATITVNSVPAAEGAGLLFTVTLDNPVAGGFTVNVSLTDAGATRGRAPPRSPGGGTSAV